MSDAAGAQTSISTPDTGRHSELLQRTLFAVVAGPVTVGIIFIGGVAFAALLAAVAGIAAWEFFRIARAGGVRPLDAVGIPLAAALPLFAAAQPRGVFTVPPALVAGALMGVFALSLWLRRADEKPLSAIATTLFGALYTGGLLSFGLALRYDRYVTSDRAGAVLVLLPVLLTWVNDIGAYAFGHLFGRRKLLPAVSPGKTIAGAVGGVVASVIVCWCYVVYVLRPVAELALSPAGTALFAIAISIAGQIGDLAESLLKREAGVKNSSGLIPGHGGVLDRLDSLLFVLPVAYMLLDIPGLLLPAPSAGLP